MAAEYAYNYNAYYRTNAAPALEPVPQRQPQPVPRPHVVPKPPRPQRPAVDRRQQERASNIKLAKLFVVMALAIALLGTFCNSFVARSNSRRALENKRAELSIYTNASVVLDQKLSKLICADNIDKIATQKLGLVKLVDSGESYLDLENGNKVLLSQSKTNR